MDKAIFKNAMKALFKFARTRGVAYFLTFLSLLFAVSCQRYAFPQITPQKIGKVDEGGFKSKHFIVHAGNNLYDLTNLATNAKMLTGTLQPASEPIYYSATRTKHYTKAEESILNEVHIFLNARYDTLALGDFAVSFKDISDVQLIRKANYAGLIFVVFLGVIGLASLSQQTFTLSPK
jgi:hypothetical protein